MTSHQLRIRLLGELEVTRPDGTAASAADFRTGKTADLLRILALNNTMPVPQSSLIDRLWPQAPADRAQASLRTAASQIRRTVGVDCIGRRAGALFLQGAWVDVEAFLAEVRTAHAAGHAGAHLRALEATRAGERLYRGDLRSHDDSSSWARTHRDHLVHQRQRMLCTGAEAAIQLRRHHEALDLASVAAQLDRTSDGAHRALMLAYAELGEVASALRVFETYRSALAEELGADPSVMTRELHIRLLRDS